MDRAELIALFVNSLLFGAFSVLYMFTSWMLLFQHKRSQKHVVVFAASTCLWALSIAYTSLVAHRALEAFMVNASNVGNAPIFYSANIASGTAVAKDVIYVTTVSIADSFLTYRLFVVWDRTWWITVLPILMVLGTAAAGYGACGDLATLDVQSSAIIPAAPPTLGPFIGTLFSLPVATNLLLTALIAGRITWSLLRTRKVLISKWHWDVLETVIESGLITSTGLAALLGTYLAESNAQFICMDALQPLIGVNFTLIILRVHYRGASEEPEPRSRASVVVRGPIGLHFGESISRTTQDFDFSVSVSDGPALQDEWSPKVIASEVR
ncbi:hypothetical protein L226DRAFT_538846 [Lentinus tigrinus ALCF2SS1-7]|uniref:Integral membrane protein n=1 Tax=Lentinus tigrinus ALCF2SS1-6 TaxID=1328759 RepID=A0A5C2RRH6_9APHY|nr:hypothetical protein L227DRAFT_580948 [Lentinus tigrinus ALCF2SS1-6]RPD70602.1 hypothetical protein L226DRAFT_538846 [Lentinus tigrinus ALCF2SS1-7]